MTTPLQDSPPDLTPDEAREAARAFLRDWLDAIPCTDPPVGLYNFDPERELLFEVKRGGPLGPYVGGTAFLAVDKKTGRVRDAGTVGE